MKEIMLTSSVLIGLIMLLRWLLRGKVSQRLLYSIWLLVALRLLIPFQFGELSFSINTLSEQVISQSETYQQVEVLLYEPVIKPQPIPILPGDSPSPPTSTTPTEAKPAITLAQALKALWLLGIGGMALWFLLTNLHFSRRAKKAAQAFQVDAPVKVMVSQSVPTPCLVGLFRPVIYLTPACAQDPQMLRHVLTHELTHWHHKDHLWSLVRCICLCIYWFHPLVWLAAAQSKRDCELACDERALITLGDQERIAYGKTLLAAVSASRTPSNLLKTATSMNESKKQLRERMCFIVKKPRNLLIAAVALVMVVALAAGCAFAGSKNPEEPAQTQPNPTEPQETQPLTEPPTEPQPTTPQEPLYPVPTVPEEMIPTLVREDIYFVQQIRIQPENQGRWKCPTGLRHELHIPQLALDSPNAKAFNTKLWAKYSPPLQELRNQTEGNAIYLCDFRWNVSNDIIGILVHDAIGFQDDAYSDTITGYYYDQSQDKELTFEEYLIAMDTDRDRVFAKVKASQVYQQNGYDARELLTCLLGEDRILAVLSDYSAPTGLLTVETAPIGSVPVVQFPEPADFDSTFPKNTPKEKLIGRWIAPVDIDSDERGDCFSYQLELKADGTVEYRWGIYGSDLLDIMTGTWKPGENTDEYILDLTSHFEDNPSYDLTSIQTFRCSKDGEALQVTWGGATQLFNFYSGTKLILYRYDSDENYYKYPMQNMTR